MEILSTIENQVRLIIYVGSIRICLRLIHEGFSFFFKQISKFYMLTRSSLILRRHMYTDSDNASIIKPSAQIDRLGTWHTKKFQSARCLMQFNKEYLINLHRFMFNFEAMLCRKIRFFFVYSGAGKYFKTSFVCHTISFVFSFCNT